MHKKFILQQKFKSKSLNYPSLKKYKQVIAELDSFTNQFYWMFDYYKNCFYYITENTSLFPKRENAFTPGMGYQCLIDNTHPNDVAYLLEIQKVAFSFFFSQKTEDRLNSKFAFKMRILTKWGDYIPVVFRIKVGFLDKEGNLWISLASGTPSQSEKFFHPLITSTLDQKVLYTPDIKHSTMDYNYPNLSPMETKVIHLMAKNKSTEEICAEFKFTPGMCKKHKIKLFKKLNATNIPVAIENARLLGIINE